jgi:hypothetical protein
VPVAQVRALLTTPTDPTLLHDVRRLTDDQPTDPWPGKK